MCMFWRSLFVLLSFFLLAIVLSVILRFTNSDYTFVIYILLVNIRLDVDYVVVKEILALKLENTFYIGFTFMCNIPLHFHLDSKIADIGRFRLSYLCSLVFLVPKMS